MDRLRLYLFFGLALLAAWYLKEKMAQAPQPAYDTAVCAGPPLRNAQERQSALEAGYQINAKYGCIDKVSFEAASRQGTTHQGQAGGTDNAGSPGITLAEARRDFRTQISLPGSGSPPLPQPPSALFVRVDYPSGNLLLPAFVTPNPRNFQRNPAIIWLTGGDSNSLSDFWSPGDAGNDQSARAFREAGVVMMFPTLRGGNSNAGGKEFFLGEVDDVLAAANYLADQPYVDPERIYLGGHSTGGTLALLISESSARFKGVFAFGPVGNIDGYGRNLIPVNFGNYDEKELKLRSPVYWTHGIARPTWIIEGRMSPSNAGELDALCGKSSSAQLHCLPVDGENHFSVLSRATKIIAAKIMNADTIPLTLGADDFGPVK